MGKNNMSIHEIDEIVLNIKEPKKMFDTNLLRNETETRLYLNCQTLYEKKLDVCPVCGLSSLDQTYGRKFEKFGRSE